MSLISELTKQAEQRPFYWQHGNIEGDLYDGLMDCAAEGGVVFVLRPSTSLELIDSLVPASINVQECKSTDRWPGTVTSIFSTVFLIRRAGKNRMKHWPKSLLQWRCPRFPEDLAIYNSAGQLWFFSKTHESDWFAAPDLCPPCFRDTLREMVNGRPLLGYAEK